MLKNNWDSFFFFDLRLVFLFPGNVFFFSLVFSVPKKMRMRVW
jgi:hypothetical protein